MPLRFRRSVKIAPGLRWNLSKRGVSTSIGGRGHSVNIGRRGVKSTVGVPGTGLSYSTTTRSKKSKKRKWACCPFSILLLPFFLFRAIFK